MLDFFSVAKIIIGLTKKVDLYLNLGWNRPYRADIKFPVYFCRLGPCMFEHDKTYFICTVNMYYLCRQYRPKAYRRLLCAKRMSTSEEGGLDQ